MNVAAFVNDAGEVVDFYEKGDLCLFAQAMGSWEVTKIVPLALKRELGLSGLRAALADSVALLGECEVFLVRELRGIVKVYLEELGFRVWKSEGSLIEQLENVELRERELLAAQPPPLPSPQPVGDPANDDYRINLAELLQSGVPHVSREVLMPFFETVAFRRLEVVCEHVPKWFPMELAELGLKVESQTPEATDGALLTAVVVPKCGPRSCPPGRRKSSGCHCGG